MRTRFTAVLLAALLAALLLAASAGATMVGIYRNNMTSTANRAQLLKLAGASCTRGGSESALRILVGKGTASCSYRTPVIGRDLEIGATERLLSGTPKSLQSKAFLGLQLRAGGGASYQLLVFPLQRKVQLLRQPGGGAAPEYLAIDKNEQAVLGINKANALRLRAINVTSGPEKGHCELSAYLGSTLVAEATDEAAGELTGRASAVSVGATKSANGVLASIDEVVVRVPVSF